MLTIARNIVLGVVVLPNGREIGSAILFTVVSTDFVNSLGVLKR
jgi:hypothetical protein